MINDLIQSYLVSIHEPPYYYVKEASLCKNNEKNIQWGFPRYRCFTNSWLIWELFGMLELKKEYRSYISFHNVRSIK